MVGIKFRAWDKELDLFEDEENVFINQNGHVYRADECEWHNNRYDIQMFTGLKGKNGKEIYEGDLFRDGGKLYIVAWLDFHAGFTVVEYSDWVKYETKDIRPLIYEDIASFQFAREVIGNIHEHQNLLKEDNDG